ncbi:MAG: SDR family NAD(P)-dependent oxidoreductase [Pseudomonadota bacterium]
MIDLNGRVALITGGGSGIGAATAARMGEAGASVVLAGIPAEQLQTTAEKLRQRDIRAAAVPTDVTSDVSVADAVRAAVAEFGRLDIVVANAGIQRHQQDRNLPELPEAEWQLTQDVNLGGVYRTCRHGLAQMLAQGEGGAVVIVSSITALTGMSPNVSYSTTKAALLGFNRHIAVHYAAQGVRCNVVCPGALEQTPDWDAHPDPSARKQTMERNIPLGRLGRSDEIAPMIAFLASDAASYTTGGQFVIDGGLTVR